MGYFQSDVIFKICIFGDGGVGKSTLIRRYLTGLFDDSTSMTIGLDFYSKQLIIKGIKIALQVWDFAGEERFRFLLPSYVMGASGGIFMYDITRFTSLKNFPEWFSIFKKGFNNSNNDEQKLPIIMIGGKSDLSEKRTVLRKHAEKIVNDENLYSYFECSSKTGENVENIFNEIVLYLLKIAKIF
ncbi:MAG: GTP-binding protein [Candidatus Lokiarchaeota archaeon]|nr:GTP-binding protein [Candidatus Lokiarchaeota archaeon]